MCGIVGYVGKQQATPILLDGLQALEYRGYDSAGLATTLSGAVCAVGKVSSLREKITQHEGTCGIAHTRWATHGIPAERNAHPHTDCSGKFYVVHNGVIENHAELKSVLLKKGHRFTSDTDTEVITHLLEDALTTKKTLLHAMHAVVPLLRGSFALVVIHTDFPDTVVVVRKGSPMVIGVGEGEYFIASDATPLVAHTKSIIYLEDGDSAEIQPRHLHIFDTRKKQVQRKTATISWNYDEARKGGYAHYMLKEIHEMGDALERAITGRVTTKGVTLKELAKFSGHIKKIRRVVITGCGTALYAGQTGARSIEHFTGLPVEVLYASESRYADVIHGPETLMIVLSQSGETADTRAALTEAKKHGALTIGIVNVVGSSIAREVAIPIMMHAGPEIGVASTKAFVVQCVLITILASEIAKIRGVRVPTIAKEIKKVINHVRATTARSAEIKTIAEKYIHMTNALFIGRKWSVSIALEGALKLKEVSYVHAEGYGAGEMKHGPLAMIDGNFPTVVVVPEDEVYEKTLSNISEIRARGGPVFAIGTTGDTQLRALSDTLFLVPKVAPYLQGILTVIPLHLFSYYSGVLRGLNVDQPRNLAKSVTVE